VRAAVSGEVALITRIPGYGLGIILDNGSGYFTIYANLSGIRVGLGEKVKTCQEMASVAIQPGKVYFEVRKGTNTLDPQKWLKGEVK
jgi:septal ring factor EnvC (AmiA/AmiB activator)